MPSPSPVDCDRTVSGSQFCHSYNTLSTRGSIDDFQPIIRPLLTKVHRCLVLLHILCRRGPSPRSHQDPLPKYPVSHLGHDGKNHDNLVPKYNGINNALKVIYKTEGLRGLYKGFYISLLCQATSMSVFFWQYPPSYPATKHARASSNVLATNG
jgi:hypothetical protein